MVEGARGKPSRTSGLQRFFGQHVFSASQVRHGKPAPDLFLLASRVMGVLPAACIVVEDSSNEVIAGKRAGMTVIGFTAGTHCPDSHADTLLADGADHVVASCDALPGLLDAIAP